MRSWEKTVALRKGCDSSIAGLPRLKDWLFVPGLGQKMRCSAPVICVADINGWPLFKDVCLYILKYGKIGLQNKYKEYI